jgi:hypothetical protein
MLKVWSSIDCGQTWVLRWVKNGPPLATMSGHLVPMGTYDWDTVSINLSNAVAAPNVRFKFQFTPPADNVAGNLYIDDINILSSNVGVEEESAPELFRVYPNPGDGNGTIAYALTENVTVNAELYDISGRLVRTIYNGEQAAGNYTMPVADENHSLAPGTYMIRMMIGDQVSTQQYIVTAQN